MKPRGRKSVKRVHRRLLQQPYTCVYNQRVLHNIMRVFYYQHSSEWDEKNPICSRFRVTVFCTYFVRILSCG